MPAKPRSRAQILRSLLKRPTPQAPAAAAVKASAYRRIHAIGPSAREQVGANAARAYRDTRMHPLAQPLPIGLAVALAAAGAMAAGGLDFFLVAAAVPVVCLSVYGAMQGAVGSVARSKAKEEIELADAFDRLVDAAARELPPSALGRLRGMKEQLVRLLAHMQHLRERAILTGEDAFFIRQAISRYVPDALQPYLALPAERRSQGERPQDNPEYLLNDQLDLISRKLASLAERADEAQLDTLRRNRTFLDRKIG